MAPDDEEERRKSDEDFAREHDPANHEISAGEESRQKGDSTAALDSWNTAEQVELAQEVAMPQFMDMVQDDLEAMFRGAEGMTYKRGSEELTHQPEPLTESDDMVIIASPCHDTSL